MGSNHLERNVLLISEPFLIGNCVIFAMGSKQYYSILLFTYMSVLSCSYYTLYQNLNFIFMPGVCEPKLLTNLLQFDPCEFQ